MDTSIKEKIVRHLEAELSSKIAEIRGAIDAARESRDNETKSSVGDKYETGRAMVQMEIEKNQAQLAKTENLLKTVKMIDLKKEYRKIEFGSFVMTNKGNYFISIAFGEVKLKGESIFCLSPLSPIGKELSGKMAGDKIVFQNREIEIKQVF